MLSIYLLLLVVAQIDIIYDGEPQWMIVVNKAFTTFNVKCG